MTRFKIEQKMALPRSEAAKLLLAIAKALGQDSDFVYEQGNSTIEMEVPNEVLVEFEIEENGDEIELEIEIKWTNSISPSKQLPQKIEPK